jgi:hypothetical protein
MSLSPRTTRAGGATVVPRAAAICVASAVLIASISQAFATGALAASMIVSAGFSGGAGTANVAGVEYAKSGAAMTLTVITDTTAVCVKLSGAHTGTSSAPSSSDTTSRTWAFAVTALTGADGARTTTVTASLDAACVTSDASATAAYTVDNTAPVVSATKSPPNNSRGWNNTAVTVTWTAVDTGSGVASGPTPATATQTTNTGGVNKTSTATDRVGNVGNGSSIVKVDLTAPSITAVVNPLPNADGWNRTNVTVSFVCSDGQSGIETCTPATPTSFTSNVTGAVVSGTAADFASNSTTTSVTVNVDKNAPTISGAPAGSPNAAGWYNADVDVVWTCADTGGSGFAAGACAGSTISSEGTGLSVSRAVSDVAGNSSAAAASNPTVNLDKTPPATTATPTTTSGGSVVTVALSATDNLSGVKATMYKLDGGSPTAYDAANPPVFSTQGSHELEYWSVDNADNSEAHRHYSTTIDTVGPSVSLAPGPAPNSNGWNNSDVTVTFTCSDATSGVATCPEPVVVSTDGANQLVSGTATDNFGNSTSASTIVSLDKTAPEVDGAASPGANSSGWHNSAVLVTFSCSDALSGVATCSAPVALSGDGAGQFAPGSATDLAGNSATATLGPINIDATAPAVTAATTPTANASGWNDTDVVVTFNCSDALSGVATCPSPVALTSEGALQPVSGTAVDNAENSSSASATVSIDKTPPTVLVVGVVDGGTYDQDTWSASCSTSDALSGVATAATVSTSGGPTGAVTVTCAGAVDVAGNGQTAPVSVEITVNPAGGSGGPSFQFGGFQRPIVSGTNSAKAGSAIPLKFSLGGYQGIAIFAAGFPASASFTCGATPPPATAVGDPTAGNGGLTYDVSTDTYTYVWKTQKAWAHCRELVLEFSDGSAATATFNFR